MGKFDNNKVDGLSTLPAADFNKNKTELRNILDKANIISSDTNLGQLAESIAIFAAKGDFYTAQFLNNTYTLTSSLSVYPPSYIDGQKVRFVIPANNTGAVLIKIGTLADIPVKTKEGTDMASGDFIIGSTAELVYESSTPSFRVNFIKGATKSISGTSLLPDPITIANNATDPARDIDFSVGNFQFDDGTGQAIATALTKQLDATWVAGTNQGGLDIGTVATDTTYHCFTIWNPTTLTADFLFSTSSSSPTLPSGYTKKRKIAALQTDGSANIRPGNYTFFQEGYRFIYSTLLTTFAAVSPAAGTDLSLDCPPNTFVLLSGAMGHSGAYSWYSVNSKLEGGQVICGTIGNIVSARSSISPSFPILCGSSSDIQHGYVSGSGSSTVDLDLDGWIEYL